jgi:hypothetical protein
MTLPPLTDEQRNALARYAVLTCFAGALLLLLDRPDSSNAMAGELMPAPPIGRSFELRTPPQARIVVHRDPFATYETFDPATTALSGSAANLVLPPNDAIDGDGEDRSDDAAATVRAVIAGPAPQALLESGGRTRILGIGARFAGAQIVGIDLRGVILSDGRRLPIERAAQ